MLELNRTAVSAPTIDLGEVLAGGDGRSPAPRRRDGRLLAQMAAARARRITPPVRSLPRRGGY
ncbi:hypothetical protein [Streptomyces sp. NPDC002540]